MLTKFCTYPGCRAVIPVGSRCCEKHAAVYAEQQKQSETQRQKLYDTSVRRVRDADITDFYQSPEWLAIRASVFAKYRSLDLWAYYIDHKIVTADMIHHILPVRTNWERRFYVGNLIPLSNTNHELIESLYRSGQQEQTQRQLIDLLKKWKAEFESSIPY